MWAASAAFGAIERSPAGCASRPCTYTLTCASAICTSAESAELQTVLDEAHLGDTIRLQAGRTWTGTSSNFAIRGRPGDGWLTITTTLADRLPLPGTRITPHYRSVMPTIRNASGSPTALRFPPSSNPARSIRIVGVRFDTQGGNQPLIQIGYNTTEPWIEDPTDIVIDRCIVENSQWLTSAGQLIGSRGHRVSILNSYIQGSIKQPTAEVQNIGRVWGECNILNNYIAENMGENIMLGGTNPDVDVEPWNHSSGEIAYNVLINHRERVPHLDWRPNTRYFKSVMVRHGGVDYRATNSGTSGSAFTLYDNGIQWVQVSGTPSSKNVFEIKNAKNLKIHHNTFEGFWTKAQYQLIVFKVANSSAPADCKPGFSGTVNVAGDVVTAAAGGSLPDLWWGSASDGSSCDITIGGTAYKIKDFDFRTPSRVVLSASAGNLTGVPYSYGSSTCYGAYLQNIAFEHNVVRKGPQAFQIVSINNARFSRIGNIRVRNNLMYDIDRSVYCMTGANCSLSQTALYFAQIPPGVDFSNNTVVETANFPYGMVWEGGYQCRGACRTISPCVDAAGLYMPIAGDTRFANNVMPKGTSQMLQGFTPSLTGSTVVSGKVCEGGCTSEKWSGNILVGSSTTGYPAGTFNLCPSASDCAVNFDYNDPVYGRLFENYAEGNYKVRTGHFAQRGGMYARQMGADWDSLPIVTKLSTGGIGVDVAATRTTIRLDYRVTAGIRHVPCVVEASTTPDIEGGRIPDLDAAVHLRPDIDGPANGMTRTVTIGARTPLESGRTYFLRLHCGGAYWEGEVTTP